MFSGRVHGMFCIREKAENLRKIGVDHASALMFPADSMAEFEDQAEWFAKTIIA